MTNTKRLHRVLLVVRICAAMVAGVLLPQEAGASNRDADMDRCIHNFDQVARQTNKPVFQVPTIANDVSRSQDVPSPSTEAPIASEEEVRANELSKDVIPTQKVWNRIKAYAYARLPGHHDDEFQMVWAPVIVKGKGDSVPGLGLVGRF